MPWRVIDLNFGMFAVLSQVTTNNHATRNAHFVISIKLLNSCQDDMKFWVNDEAAI